MSHKHPVYDSDPHFTIDPITRKITNQTAGKTKIIQGDHNSERFTFDIPRLVDGHDMSLCDKVEIHYINISTNGAQQNADVYPVDDIAINKEADKVYFSWLISQNATQIVGTLNFIIKFFCLDGEKITYLWNTDVFKSITISDGINSGESVVVEYPDIIEVWKREALSELKKMLNEIRPAETYYLANFYHDTNYSRMSLAKSARVGDNIAVAVPTGWRVELMFFKTDGTSSAQTVTSPDKDQAYKLTVDEDYNDIWFTASLISWEAFSADECPVTVTVEKDRIGKIEKDIEDIKQDLGDIDEALDAIIAIQNAYIGGEA